MPIALPHHDGSNLFVSNTAPGPVSLGDTVRLRVRVPQDCRPASKVWVRSVQDGEPRYDAAFRLGSADGWDWWEAAKLVANPVAKYRFLLEVTDTHDDGAAAGTPTGGALVGTTVGRRYWNSTPKACSPGTFRIQQTLG